MSFLYLFGFVVSHVRIHTHTAQQQSKVVEKKSYLLCENVVINICFPLFYNWSEAVYLKLVHDRVLHFTRSFLPYGLKQNAWQCVKTLNDILYIQYCLLRLCTGPQAYSYPDGCGQKYLRVRTDLGGCKQKY